MTIIEADDEQAALAFAMAVGSAGNIRTHTLRAFNAEEISAVLPVGWVERSDTHQRNHPTARRMG